MNRASAIVNNTLKSCLIFVLHVIKIIRCYRVKLEPTRKIKRILVTQIHLIGDIVLSTPVFKCLRDSFPEAEVILLISGSGKELLSTNPHIAQIIEFKHGREKGLNAFFDIMRMFCLLRSYNFDLSIHLDKDAPPVILSFLLGIPEIIGFGHETNESRYRARFEFLMTRSLPSMYFTSMHRVDANKALLKLAGSNCSRGVYPQIFVNSPSKQFAGEFFSNNKIKDNDFTVLIHPGSSLKEKKWPIENFIQLTEFLLDATRIKAIFLIGPSENKEKTDILSSSLGNRVVILENCSLLQYACVVEQVKLFVGNDSGPMHIAASMKVPCVILFGPSEPNVFAPYWVNHLALKSTSCEIASISLRIVTDAVNDLISKLQ